MKKGGKFSGLNTFLGDNIFNIGYKKDKYLLYP